MTFSYLRNYFYLCLRLQIFVRKFVLDLRKELLQCYTLSSALYDAQSWTPLKGDQEYLGSFKMWCWRRKENIIWKDRVIMY